VAPENRTNGAWNIATKLARHTAIAAATGSGWTTKSTIARRRRTNAIVAIRRPSATFVAASATIVDVIIEVRARAVATIEIAKAASHTARTATRAAARTARAPRTHTAALSTGAHSAIAPRAA